jgi:hypothetical protein
MAEVNLLARLVLEAVSQLAVLQPPEPCLDVLNLTSRAAGGNLDVRRPIVHQQSREAGPGDRGCKHAVAAL